MGNRKETAWKAACLAIVLFMAGSAWGQPPDTISYQGFLTDSSGTPINSGVDMAVEFYDTSSGGTALYAEDHSNVTVSNGQFNLLLGSGSTTGSWPDDVDFTKALWIEITAGGETLSPRIPMSAVSYARFAFIVADGSVTASKLNGDPGDGTSGQVLSSDGTGGFSWADGVGAMVESAEITDANVTEDKLASSLTFDDGDLLDFSGITADTGTEGIRLPAYNMAAVSDGQISWDAGNDKLYIGDGSAVIEIGAAGSAGPAGATGPLDQQDPREIQEQLDPRGIREIQVPLVQPAPKDQQAPLVQQDQQVPLVQQARLVQQVRPAATPWATAWMSRQGR